MPRPLGPRQIATLAALASPHHLQVTANAADPVRSLARRGLMRARGTDGDTFWQITPAGLRALAHAWQTGLVTFDLPDKLRDPQS